MTDLWRLSATEVASGVANGDFGAAEVMSSVVGRIEATNPSLNAITIDLSEEAMAEAAAADDAQAAGKELGPLHGVPVTIKENIDIAGQPTTNGIPAFADVIATEDSPLVQSLRAAGAIVVGRTNTPEFSMRGDTDNPLRGRTHNPWDPTASAGGSSGGAGSACAAGMGPLHHGNDIGGSLRFPSFCNGVTSIKPTTARVPAFNSTATAERGPMAQAMSVQGVIARHVADVRLATRIMITPDPRDPVSPPIPWDGPDLGAKPTVAVTTQSHGYPIHDGIVALVRDAADLLRDGGYNVVEVEPPPIKEAAREWFRAGTTEMEATLLPAIREFGSETINNIFDWYFDRSEILDRDDLIRAMADRTRILREWSLFLDQYPLVLTPFLMRPTYDADYDATEAGVHDMFDSAIYSFGINYLGLPAGIIATGMIDERPAAVQIVGRSYREDLIADALEAIESRNGVLAHPLWDRE